MPQDAPARAGLPDPGGDPSALHHNALGWAEISAFLTEHSAHIAELTAACVRSWEGETAKAFATRGKFLADDAAAAARTAAAVAARQQDHAKTHETVEQIIIELCVQIAVMLAFYAAAALFPPLLAWAQAYLAFLITTGVRVLRLLAQALNALVRFLVQVRALVTSFAERTWTTSEFAVGYGRMATEGVRDVAIDLTANLVAAGVRHKKIDPAQLFVSAGISGGIGGVVGGLEKTGFKKVLDEAGEVKRGAGGLPEFVPIGKQAQNAVKKIGPRPRPATRPAEALAEANVTVRSIGDDVWTHEQTVRVFRRAVDEADLRVRSAETSLSLYRASGNGTWVDEGARQLADARAEFAAASEGLRTAEAAHRLAEERANASIRREAAGNQPTPREKFAFVRRNNEWKASFGSAKKWQEIVFYDIPKDALKGTANGAAKSAAEVARGNGDRGDIGKDALLGGATGAVRGGVNSWGSNRAFPAGGIEETLWKTGSKTTDDHVRREIKGATSGSGA